MPAQRYQTFAKNFEIWRENLFQKNRFNFDWWPSSIHFLKMAF